MWMRGGTSKGGYFLADDLPADAAARDAFLLRVMGSPDPRQIDGMGGADPLTRKVAVVSRSERDGRRRRLSVPAGLRRPGDRHRRAELRQHPRRRRPVRDRARAGRGDGTTRPGSRSSWRIPARSRSRRCRRPAAVSTYAGDARIDGVPGTAAPVPLEFRDTAGSSCGALLPTGNAVDEIDGVRCTLIDNGMPCVVFRAEDVGATGYEDRDDARCRSPSSKARIEAIRLEAGPLMNLGDVSGQIGAQDDAGRPAAARRRGHRAQLHPAPRPCLDRRARRGQRRHRLPDRRLARGRGRAGPRGPPQDACRSSIRPAR